MPDSIFLVRDTIGGQNRWMRADGYPSRRMLGSGQIVEMQTAGIRSGSHPRLSSLSRHDAEAEVRGSKLDLEQKLGRAVDYFAYP
jgi:hypothetical protein